VSLCEIAAGLAARPGSVQGLATDLGLATDTGLDHASNLLVFPNGFTAAPWDTTQQITLAPNFPDPNGTNFAWNLLDNAANNDHAIQQHITTLGAQGQLCAASLYVKQNNGRYCCIGFSNDTNAVFACIDTQAGAITQQIATGTGVLAGADLRALGNGWYRARVVGRVPGIDVFYTAALANSATPGVLAPIYAGTGTGVFIWHARLSFGGA